jgi:hypothetical protein
MIVFEVSVNGKIHKAIGVEGDGVTSVVLSCAHPRERPGHGSTAKRRREISLTLTGLERTAQGQKMIVRWAPVVPSTGDTVSIRILEADNHDAPDEVEVVDPDEEAAKKSKYLQLMNREAKRQQKGPKKD